MKKLKQLIKGAMMASAVVRVCVEAYKAAKAEADAVVEDALTEAVSDGVEPSKGFEPFDIISVGGEVCFLDGDGDVLIMDGDGAVN